VEEAGSGRHWVLGREVVGSRAAAMGRDEETMAVAGARFVAWFRVFLPTPTFLPPGSGNGARYTANYRANSNFKPKMILTASSNGYKRYTAV
jgi:hypothetical protein